MRVVVGTAVRGVLTAAALVAAYYLLPLDASGPGAVAVLAGGLLLVLLVIGWQLRAILRSPHPALRAVRAMAVVVPLFLLLFATGHLLLSRAVPGSFTEPLDRTGALYFTVTVFATVGFGDIAPRTDAARILVTAQMIGDLLVVGGLLRVVVLAVRTGRARRDRERESGPDPERREPDSSVTGEASWPGPPSRSGPGRQRRRRRGRMP